MDSAHPDFIEVYEGLIDPTWCAALCRREFVSAFTVMPFVRRSLSAAGKAQCRKRVCLGIFRVFGKP